MRQTWQSRFPVPKRNHDTCSVWTACPIHQRTRFLALCQSTPLTSVSHYICFPPYRNAPSSTDQFNRLEREHQETILAFFQHLVGGDCLDAQNCAFEILDRVGVETRWCNRRGVGWMPEDTDKGKCSRLGFFHGFHLLTVVNPDGIITGFGVATASTPDQPLADAVFTARHTRDPRCPGAGLPCRSGDYIGDRGFIGQEWHERLRNVFGINLINPPRKTDAAAKFWPKVLAQSFVSLAGGSAADCGVGP